MKKPRAEIDKRKIEILTALSNQPMTWSQIRDKFKLTTPTVSRILKEMREAGEVMKTTNPRTNKQLYRPLKLMKPDYERMEMAIMKARKILLEVNKKGLFSKGLSEKDIIQLGKPEVKGDKLFYDDFNYFISDMHLHLFPVLSKLNPEVETKLTYKINFKEVIKELDQQLKSIRKMKKK